MQGNSRTCTPSSLYRQLLVPQVGQLDTTLINDLECEAQRMATSIDNLIENLCGILHSVSYTLMTLYSISLQYEYRLTDLFDYFISSVPCKTFLRSRDLN